MDILEITLISLVILGQIAGAILQWRRNGTVGEQVASLLSRYEDKIRKQADKLKGKGAEPPRNHQEALSGQYQLFGLDLPGPPSDINNKPETAEEFIKSIERG